MHARMRDKSCGHVTLDMQVYRGIPSGILLLLLTLEDNSISLRLVQYLSLLCRNMLCRCSAVLVARLCL